MIKRENRTKSNYKRQAGTRTISFESMGDVVLLIASSMTIDIIGFRWAARLTEC